MTKTTELADQYACAHYSEYSTDGGWSTESDYEAIRVAYEVAYEDGAHDMLERVLDFMRTFQDGSGNYPLYDYIGNVRKAMEE